ncbi:MAG: exported protein of unknown function [Candidatus Saccharibacteria bacterium]|nr:exported protein of unknown function [Candidatus Saccharibacteria bacterium]
MIGRIVIVVSLLVVATSTITAADSFSSSNYKIDASVGGPLGGSPASTNYKMVVSGGENAIGTTNSSSYKLTYGYVAQLDQAIQLTNLTPSVSFGTLTAGSSSTVALSYQVLTDAPSYNLAINQDHDLLKGTDTIPAMTGGNITTPTAWSEGTTKGLGLTITSGPSVPGKWGTSPNYNYAAIPGSATTFYSRSGFGGGSTDSISLQGRVDVTTAQATGSYSNTVTITATTIP